MESPLQSTNNVHIAICSRCSYALSLQLLLISLNFFFFFFFFFFNSEVAGGWGREQEGKHFNKAYAMHVGRFLTCTLLNMMAEQIGWRAPVGRHTIDCLEQRHYLRAQTNDFTPSTAWRRHYLWAQSHGYHTCGTSHHRPPGGDTTCGHKAMDTTPVGHHTIDRLEETLPAGTKLWTSRHRLPTRDTTC